MINDHARRLLIDKILKKLNSKISFNGKNMTYSDIILYQGRHMADYLTNKILMRVFTLDGDSNKFSFCAIDLNF